MTATYGDEQGLPVDRLMVLGKGLGYGVGTELRTETLFLLCSIVAGTIRKKGG